MSASLLKALALPEFSSDNDKAPQFTTPETCKAWIKALPITNAPQAQLRLRYQLESFNRYALPEDFSATSRLDMLEQLRVPVLFVQAECGKRFIKQNFPLPLPETERIAFNSAQALWQALWTGYLQVLRVLLERTYSTSLNETERHAAARAARCALTSARSDYLLHLHSGFLPEAAYWYRLHQTLRLAEALEVAQYHVGHKSSAVAVYVEVLLLSMAHLYRLSSKQKEQIAYWAQRWASRVSLLSQPPTDLRTPSIMVDVLGGRSPDYAMTEAIVTHESMCRWLDLRDLRKTIKQRLLKLSEGSSPQELHLGDICSQPECGELLDQVYRDWCKGGRSPSRNSPEKSFEHCEWVSGVEAIYHQLGGQKIKASRVEVRSPYQTRRSHEEIAVLGDVIRHGIQNDGASPEPTHIIEHWQILDENLHQIFLQYVRDERHEQDDQIKPLRVEQLVVVRLKRLQPQAIPTAGVDDRSVWQLARIHWLVLDRDTTHMRVGIQLFPGVPRAVQIFVSAHGDTKAQTIPGMCLSAVSSLNQPATVLMSPEGFSVDRVMEIRSTEGAASPSQIRLVRRLERGADFERWTYEVMT